MQTRRSIFLIVFLAVLPDFSSQLFGQTIQPKDTCITFQDTTTEAANSVTTVTREYYPTLCTKKSYRRKIVTAYSKSTGFKATERVIHWDSAGTVTYKSRSRHKCLHTRKGVYNKYITWEFRVNGKRMLRRKKSIQTSYPRH